MHLCKTMSLSEAAPKRGADCLNKEEKIKYAEADLYMRGKCWQNQ